MRVGSVEFFKVLIKTVLGIVFVAPLIVAVIFGVILINKNKELDDLNKNVEDLNKKNTALTMAADVVVGKYAGTAEDFNLIFERSGISYEDLMELLFEKGKLDTENVYKIFSAAGVSDKELISAALNKNGSDADSLYVTLKNAGLSDEQISAIAELAKKKSEQSGHPTISTSGGNSVPSSQSTSDNSSSGGSDNSSTSGSSSTSSTSSSSNTSSTMSTSSTSSVNTSVPTDKSYMSKYPDMYVDAPTDYVRETKTIYLTFDDGPSDNVYTIVDLILKKYGIKATFFVVPDANSNVTEKLKYIANNGHAIGIHSATHDYEKIYESVDAFLDDFYEAWMIVYKATGIKTEIFRFPGGSNTDYNADTRDEIIAEMTRRGFRYYDWNVQSNDILNYTWTQMYNKILSEVGNSERSIVLFHDRADNGVNVLEDIIKVLLDRGYKFDKINNDTMPYQFVGSFS